MLRHWSSLVALVATLSCGESPPTSSEGADEAAVAPPPEPPPAPMKEPARRAAPTSGEPVMQTQHVEIDVEVPVEARDRMAVAGQEALEELARQRGYEGVKGVRLLKPSCDEKCRVHVEGEAWRAVPATSASSGSGSPSPP